MNIKYLNQQVLDQLKILEDAVESHTKQTTFTSDSQNLISIVDRVGKSWSKSWIGYQSRVYYYGFNAPPANAIFSREWGLKELPFVGGTVGNWVLYEYEYIENYILQCAGNPNLAQLEKYSQQEKEKFEEIKSNVLSIISLYLSSIDDSYIRKIDEIISSLKCYSKEDIAKSVMPKGTITTRDSLAIDEGLQVPPHIAINALVLSLNSPILAMENLLKQIKIVATHFSHIDQGGPSDMKTGIKIFIGHGGSKQWMVLKDFLHDKLHLSWEEFNRVPAAGIPTAERLSEMLNNASFAFLVLTAEDEQIDGKKNPRMNVVHEAGLFQGRLGFKKAIILLEDGCEEFSNIYGLGQTRFPKDKIEACFEEVRSILEREDIIKSY